MSAVGRPPTPAQTQRRCLTLAVAATRGDEQPARVDVKAPLATGHYTVKARVAALQFDTNPADNQASATTEIPD